MRPSAPPAAARFHRVAYKIKPLSLFRNLVNSRIKFSMSRNYKFHNPTLGSNYLLPQSQTRGLVRQRRGLVFNDMIKRIGKELFFKTLHRGPQREHRGTLRNFSVNLCAFFVPLCATRKKSNVVSHPLQFQ